MVVVETAVVVWGRVVATIWEVLSAVVVVVVSTVFDEQETNRVITNKNNKNHRSSLYFMKN